MKRFTNLINSSIFNYTLLFIALAYSFVFIFFGIDFKDTFFYINLCEDYTSFPLMTLTLIIGKGWTSLFGESLISFRVLNWTIWILSVLLPFYILIPGNLRKGNLKYLAVSVICISILNYNIFGGDGCTLLFLALSTSLTIKYYQTNRLIYLLLYGLFSSLLILTRFSNIVILPASIIVLGIIEYGKNYQKLQKNKFVISLSKKTGIYFGITISFYLLINILIYGSLPEFISKLTISLLNIDESHVMMSMIKSYANDLVKLFQYFSVCILIYIIVNNRLKLNLLIQKIFLVSSIIVFVLFLIVEVGLGMYNWNISLLYSAIVCSVLLLNCILFIQNKEYTSLVYISIVFVFSIIPVIGSNTGLLKLSPFLIAFLPTLITSNKIVIIRNSHLSYFFAIFLLFVFYTKLMIVYEDSKITSLKYEIKTEKINHIKTTKVNVEFIEEGLNAYKACKKDSTIVLFYGSSSYIFYYLTNTKPLYQNSFWMLPESIKEVKRAEPVIVSKRPIVFFMPEYPNNATKYFKNRKAISQFETMLIKNGYIATEKNGYVIYNP